MMITISVKEVRSSEQPVNFYIKDDFWGETIFEGPKKEELTQR